MSKLILEYAVSPAELEAKEYPPHEVSDIILHISGLEQVGPEQFRLVDPPLVTTVKPDWELVERGFKQDLDKRVREKLTEALVRHNIMEILYKRIENMAISP